MGRGQKFQKPYQDVNHKQLNWHFMVHPCPINQAYIAAVISFFRK